MNNEATSGGALINLHELGLTEQNMSLHDQRVSSSAALSAESRLKRQVNWVDSEYVNLPVVTKDSYEPGILILPDQINPEHESLSIVWSESLEEYTDKKSGSHYSRNKMIIDGVHGHLGIEYAADDGREYTIIYTEIVQNTGQENEGLYLVIQTPPLSEREHYKQADNGMNETLEKIELLSVKSMDESLAA